jgi:glycerophosphoryl diester phosphodiesterase
LAPENTMAAFRKARELGAPGLELDVHACASGELVVAHDDTFKRTAPPENAGEGRDIACLALDAIRRIDVGVFFDPAFSGERPPLLEEVAEEFCPDMYIDIELKSRKVRNDPLPALAAAKIKSFGDRAQKAIAVSSFNPFCLAVFQQLCPRIPAAVIWSADPDVPLVLRHGLGRRIANCDYVKPVHTQVNPQSYPRMTLREGRPMVPWVVDDPVLARRMLELGCRGIITNRPQDLMPLIAEEQARG